MIAEGSAVFVLAALHAGRRWRDLLAGHQWSFRRNAFVFIPLLIVVLGLNLGAGAISNYFVPETGGANELPPFGPSLAIALFSSAVLAPFWEELLLRGWFYTALRPKLAAWPAIVVVAIVFSLLHAGVSVGSIVSTLPLGVAAGYLRVFGIAATGLCMRK